MVPVRGQVVLAATPGIGEFLVAYGDRPHEVRYLFPHGDVVLLGGTEEEGNWNLEPDPRTAERIVRDCAAIEPACEAPAWSATGWACGHSSRRCASKRSGWGTGGY